MFIKSVICNRFQWNFDKKSVSSLTSHMLKFQTIWVTCSWDITNCMRDRYKKITLYINDLKMYLLVIHYLDFFFKQNRNERSLINGSSNWNRDRTYIGLFNSFIVYNVGKISDDSTYYFNSEIKKSLEKE